MRLRGCLTKLNDLQLRVVVLRAGLGSADPRSRAQVARILDIGGSRVRRVERRAVRRLRRADRRGACEPGDPAPARAVEVVRSLVGAAATSGQTVLVDQPATVLDSTAAGPRPQAGDGSGGSVRDGATDGSGSDRGGVKGERETSSPRVLAAPAPVAGGGVPLWPPLVLALLLGGLVAREVAKGRAERRAVRRYRGNYGD